MLSQALAGGDGGREEHGQASPIETPSTCVREGGQIAERPSIRTDQRVGIDTMGTEDARVDGWEIK